MNEKRVFSLLGLLLFLLIAGCSGGQDNAPPLQGAKLGGAFTLVDQDGKQVSDRQFDRKYRIVYFGYTFCPDVCPVDLQLISAALRRFEQQDPGRAARVQPLFITTDPQRDTPPVLRAYVANFHPRLIGLTGSRDEIGRLMRAYGVYAAPREPAAPGAPYLVDHNRIIVLYGLQGEPIAILPSDHGPAGMVAALERWVR